MLRLFKANTISRGFVSSIAMAGLLAGASVYSQGSFAADDDGQRKPPATRSSEVLSERVFKAINDIQEIMSPEDGSEPNYARAKEELDDLNERYDRMNNFEKSTLLNFYTNYYLSTDNIEMALQTFEKILTLEDTREEVRLRALMALGQLYMGEERYEESIDAFNRWRDLSLEENKNVYLGLANSYYNLAKYNEAIPFLIDHMNLLTANGEAINKNIYGLLNLMYIELEDYVSAERTTKQMVTLFDEAADWRNLSAIYGYLDNDAKRIQTLGLTFSKGYMQNEAEYLNLSQSLAGADAPYTGARVLEAGLAAGVVDADKDNLDKLVQMYLLATEYEKALEPALKVADMDETGDGYDQLGYIYYLMHDYKNAADSIRKALERGGLDDVGDTQLFLARALVELNEFDGAATAAKRAKDLGQRGADNFLTYIEGSKARYDNIQQRKQDAIEFYRS